MLGPKEKPMRNLLAIAIVLIALPGAAYAADFLINNGLDCSNPGNVIDHTTHQNNTVYVRNVGCGTPYPYSPCPSPPGAATEVCVVDGGLVDVLYPHDSSIVTMTDGAVTGGLVAHDYSAITMNGGVVDTLGAYESSTVTLNSGSVDWLYAADSSTGIMNGGKVLIGLDAFNSGTVTMSGGKVWSLQAYDSSTITIAGCYFAVDGSPVPYGDLTAQTGRLTGKVASSVHAIDSAFDQGGGSYTGTITLVYAPSIPALPEWGYLALAGGLIVVGVVVMRRRAG
jgi:hypothetical protein